MKKQTSTLLALPLLFGLTGTAQATLLEIELTGALTTGSDTTNEFGLGTNFDLTGQTATFRWLIDTSQLGTDYDNGTTVSVYQDCADGACGNNPFISATVTINGITKTTQRYTTQPYDSYLYIGEDQDGVATANADGLLVRGYDFSEFYGSHRRIAYIDLYAYDFVESIITGTGVNQLDGWSTNLITNSNDYGYAFFSFYEYGFDAYNSCRDCASGIIYLNSASLIWGDGYAGNNNNNPVPEPASLALLGIGLAGIGVIRRRRRTA